jgi:hypothetical protein
MNKTGLMLFTNERLQMLEDAIQHVLLEPLKHATPSTKTILKQPYQPLKQQHQPLKLNTAGKSLPVIQSEIYARYREGTDILTKRFDLFPRKPLIVTCSQFLRNCEQAKPRLAICTLAGVHGCNYRYFFFVFTCGDDIKEPAVLSKTLSQRIRT